MASPKTHYPAYVAYFDSGVEMVNHHNAIFVHTADGDMEEPRGFFLHATTHHQDAMEYEEKFKSVGYDEKVESRAVRTTDGDKFLHVVGSDQQPALTLAFSELQQHGWISHDRLSEIEDIALTVVPSKDQVRLLRANEEFPLYQPYSCIHCTEDILKELRKRGIFTPLAPNESVDRRYYWDQDGDLVLSVEGKE